METTGKGYGNGHGSGYGSGYGNGDGNNYNQAVKPTSNGKCKAKDKGFTS